MRFRVIVSLIIVVLVATSATHVSAVEIGAKAYILTDLTTGKVLSAYRQEAVVYPASLTKLLTAWIVVQKADLSEPVTISENAVRVEGTRAYFRAGEQYTVEELLYALLLRSANDAAIALAEHVAGDTEKFVCMMNEEASRLGAAKSHFTNPHGLHDADHYTTPDDFALLCRRIFSHNLIRNISSQYSKVIANPAEQYDRLLITTNDLINPNSPYYYSHARFGKTGYTSQAGQCIAAVATEGNQELLALLFDCQGRQVWTDCRHLLEYGFKKYDCIELAQGLAVLGAYEIPGGTRTLFVAAARPVYTVVDSSARPINFSVDIQLSEGLEAPVTRGETVGVAVFTDGETILAKEDLVAVYAVSRRQAGRHWFLLLVACMLAMLLLFKFLLQKHTRNQGTAYNGGTN